MEFRLLASHLDPAHHALTPADDHVVDRVSDTRERDGRVLQLVIRPIRLGQECRLHAVGRRRRQRARDTLEDACCVHGGAFDEPEPGVVADRIRQTDTPVGGVLATELGRHEALGIAEQALPGLAAAVEILAEWRGGKRGEPVEDERQICQAHRDPELFGGNGLELVRLVDDQRLIRPEHLALPLGAGEQECVVCDNNGCI